jgi:hypothetical protein
VKELSAECAASSREAYLCSVGHRPSTAPKNSRTHPTYDGGRDSSGSTVFCVHVLHECGEYEVLRFQLTVTGGEAEAG